MLRFLVKFLLMAIILAAITILTAQWKLEKDIDAFAGAIKPFAEFDYESAKIGLSGEVRVNSISIFIESISATVEIGELRFFAGNLYELAFFESNVRQNKLPENAHIFLTDVLIPFNPQLIRTLKEDVPATTMDLINASFCGENDRIGIEEFEAMGYDYLSFSGKEFYLLDKYSGSVVVNGSFDFEDMFDIEYQFNVSGVMAWLESMEERRIGQFQQELIMPQLSLLEIRKKDAGYNRRKAEFCAIKESVEPEEYYTKHIEQIEALLSEANIELKEDAKLAYSKLIQPESQLQFFIQPKANFEFDGLNYYSQQELIDMSGLRVTIDGEEVKEYFENWTAKDFQQIAPNLLQKRVAEQNSQQLYQQVIVTKNYHDVNPSTANSYLNERVRITRDDGRVFEGELSRTSERSVWLYQRQPTGDITIPIARTRVVKFEVYQ